MDAMAENESRFEFGFTGEDKYIYNGDDVEVPFYLENSNSSEGEEVTVGIILLIDGNVQSYKLDESDGEEVFKRITLKPGENKDITFYFKPVSGKKGDTVGILPVLIYNPDSLPEENAACFGNNQSLCTNIPLEIEMKKDGENNLKEIKDGVEMGDIPEEIVAEYKSTIASGVQDSLDADCVFSILKENDDSCVINGKNGKITITMRMFGGLNVEDKVTVFVNNKPVKINGGDYFTVKMQKGKMATITFDLDLSEYDEINSIYAIAMTSGKYYELQDVYKTDSMLLVNR